MTPAVSVVVATHNYGRYLAGALESALGQTFRDFELIAVEGGSNDRSRAILAEFAARDARLRITEQRGRGLVCAYSAGQTDHYRIHGRG